jgi:hypothetical protein
VDKDTALSQIEKLKVRDLIRDTNGSRSINKAAEFVPQFSGIASDAPWANFTFEINPIMVGRDHAAAVDGLLIIEYSGGPSRNEKLIMAVK